MGSFCTKSVEIRGIVASTPPNVLPLKYSADSIFSAEDIEKIKTMTGIESRVVVSPDICASDLMTDAAQDLIRSLEWSSDSIDLLVVVTQSGDYLLPATSCIIQKNLNLSKKCLAFDIGLGCSGYTYGMGIVSSMMQGGQLRRALLLAGDTSSRMASPTDRSTALLFGDIGTATALEFSASTPSQKPWAFVGGTDGNGFCNLIMKNGGFRNPFSAKEATERQSEGDLRQLFMDGGEIFKFTIEVVPGLVKETLALAETSVEAIDYFIMHQANLFLLKHLAKKLKIPAEKMPITLDRYGNTSSASIPLTIIDGVGSLFDGRSLQLVLLGFGVGYSWGGLFLPIDNRIHCRIKNFEAAAERA